MTIQTHTWQHCTNGHNPAAGEHHKSFGLIGALDDFSFELGQEVRERLMEFRSLIAAVGKQLLQERIHPEQSGKKQDTAVAILDIGGGEKGGGDQTKPAITRT